MLRELDALVAAGPGGDSWFTVRSTWGPGGAPKGSSVLGLANYLRAAEADVVRRGGGGARAAVALFWGFGGRGGRARGGSQRLRAPARAAAS